MKIAKQVNELPEIGMSLVHEAARLDQRQDYLDEQQAQLNASRAMFINELLEDYSQDELNNAGIFGAKAIA